MLPRWLNTYMPVLGRVRTTALAMVAMLIVVGGASLSSVVGAHDGIAGSDPASRSHIDDPISSATIDFGVEISEGVEMALTYDIGNGRDVEFIGGETTKTGPTTARVDFDMIEKEGTYFVRYLAPVPADGHTLAGSISFTYGSPSSDGSGGFPIVPFVAVSAVILAVGVYFSWRRMQQPQDDAVPAEAD